MMWAQLEWGGKDPTALAWGCALAYVVAGAVCIAVGVRTQSGPPRSTLASGLWTPLGVLLGLLGVNKELDLHSVFVHVVRDGTQMSGIYDYKRQIAALFFLGVIVTAVAVGWHRRRQLAAFAGAHRVAVAGLGLIAIYTVTRFAAITHVAPNWLIRVEDSPAFPALELVGSLLIVFEAVTEMRNPRFAPEG